MIRKFPLTGAIKFSIHTKFSDEFIDFLVKQFEIPDRDALIKAILVAKNAYDNIHLFGEEGGHWNEEEADRLDALDEPLRDALRLTRLASWPIAQELERSGGGGFGSTADEIEKQVESLCDRLAVVGHAAATAPRRRRRPSRPEHVALRAFARPLVAYWTGTLGRKFTQNQRWAPDARGREVPVTVATRFLYAVIEHLAPGKGNGLRTIAREFTHLRKVS